MFIFDVETLGKKTDSVMLSMACIYFNPNTKPDHIHLKNTAFFSKFSVQDQVTRLNRKMDKSTLDWWSNQSQNAKTQSFIPHPSDTTIEQGIQSFQSWVDSFNPTKNTPVFARGNLDQLILDSFHDQLNIPPVFPHYKWRDVRTAIDLIFNTTTGYCKTNHPTFNPDIHITKHNPIDDCVFDAMMLMYGIDQNTNK